MASRSARFTREFVSFCSRARNAGRRSGFCSMPSVSTELSRFFTSGEESCARSRTLFIAVRRSESVSAVFRSPASARIGFPASSRNGAPVSKRRTACFSSASFSTERVTGIFVSAGPSSRKIPPSFQSVSRADTSSPSVSTSVATSLACSAESSSTTALATS